MRNFCFVVLQPFWPVPSCHEELCSLRVLTLCRFAVGTDIELAEAIQIAQSTGGSSKMLRLALVPKNLSASTFPHSALAASTAIPATSPMSAPL